MNIPPVIDHAKRKLCLCQCPTCSCRVVVEGEHWTDPDSLSCELYEACAPGVDCGMCEPMEYCSRYVEGDEKKDDPEHNSDQ